MNDGTLVRVVLPFAVAGVIVDARGVIVCTAPILWRFRGQRLTALAGWVASRRGTLAACELLPAECTSE